MKRTLNIVSLVIAGIVALNEFRWIGRSDLAIMILCLAVAIGLIAIGNIIKNE